MSGQNLNGVVPSTLDRAAALRADFDRVFAEPARSENRETIDFLAMRLGGDAFAIRLEQTAGLFSDRKVTPVPTSLPAFSGIAGLRGAIVPVYDLGVLLGYFPALSLRWLVVAREVSVAFAFDVFDGQLRADRGDLLAHEATPSRGHTAEVVRISGISRPVVDLSSVVAALRGRADGAMSRKEP